jgi:hypothetical protein
VAQRTFLVKYSFFNGRYWKEETGRLHASDPWTAGSKAHREAKIRARKYGIRRIEEHVVKIKELKNLIREESE